VSVISISWMFFILLTPIIILNYIFHTCSFFRIYHLNKNTCYNKMSSSIKFLTSKDFSVSDGNLLCSVPNYSIVMFYSTQCQYCDVMKDIFMELNQTIIGCTFAMLNLGEHRDVVAKSKKTNVELQYVPMVIFYANNKPYMVYAGPSNAEDLESFIVDVSNDYTSKHKKQKSKSVFAPDETSAAASNNKDACVIGDKDCLEKKAYENKQKMCYVTMKEAYGGKAS